MASIIVSDRSGTSPIGTTSPNTGAAANTNSTYAVNAFSSGIATIGTATTYTVNNSDYQGIVVFSTTSACTVTLNSAVNTNFTCNITNISTGAITLSPTLGYTVNGLASITLLSGQGATVNFANRAWTAFIGSTVLPPAILVGTTGSLGGSLMTAGQTITATATVTGATTAMVAVCSPAVNPGASFCFDSFVSSANTVTVRLTCVLAGTPAAGNYNVRCLQ